MPGQAIRIERLWQEFLSDPSQWWDNRADKKGPRSPDFRHKLTKEVLWTENSLNPPWVKAELATLPEARSKSDDGPFVHGAPGREINRIVRLNHDQLSVGGKGSTANLSPTFERGPSERVYLRTLCKAGRLKEALHIISQQGIGADSNIYACILHECIKRKALAEGKQVHAHIVQSGFKPNIFLFNTLVNMYAKCGSVVDARQLFDKMPERDMCTWTTMMAGYAKHGHAEAAMNIYEKMRSERVTPDRVTFTCILNACASLGALEKGKKIHADIRKAGILSDIIQETALADMYAKCGSMKDSQQVFDNMANRNVVSWNAMIAGYVQHGCGREAFEMYEQMQREGVTPNRVTFISALNACVSLGALEKGKEVHATILKAGIQSYVKLENTLVDMYAKCGSVRDARQVFDNMGQQDVVSWNAMIGGYARQGCVTEAFEIYVQMQREEVTPNRVTFICILNACASPGALAKGKGVHADIMRAGGTLSYAHLETALLDMYVRCGSMKDANKLFENLTQRDVLSWNIMIAGYAQHGCGMEALVSYEKMLYEGLVPDRVTFICTLNVCASLKSLDKGKEVHADIIKAAIAADAIVETALADMYAKCGNMKDAQEVFNTMSTRDVVTWSMMIAGYVQHGCGREALEMYEQMKREGVKADMVTFTCVLNACASIEVLETGKQVHADISKSGIVADITLENSLVDMYSKCGSMKDACGVFDNMSRRNLVSWNTMIAGCARHGCGRQAVQLFKQMQLDGFKPDGITFVSLLFACSHAGLVDEGHLYFYSMIQDHGLTHADEHFACMVDLLGRAGRLDEAEDFIEKMPLKPADGVWKALLGACMIHGDVERAERATKTFLRVIRKALLGACMIHGDVEGAERAAKNILKSDP